MKILLVSASRLTGKYPQRSYHLLRALKELGVDAVGVESYYPIIGIISVIKNRKIKWKIFSGFRAGVAGLALSFFGIKWIYDLVEAKSKLCNDNWRGIKRLLVPLIDILEGLMIKRASIVFAAHESAYRYALKVRKDVFLIPNGYDDVLFNPKNYDRISLRSYYEVTFPLAIYMRRLTPMYAKFLSAAIRAFDLVIEDFPNAEFWIIGDGSEKKNLKKIASKNVKFKEPIAHENVPEIIAIADVGIHAYDMESLKLIEWLAMGLPSIVPKGLKFDGAIECEWVPKEIAKQIIQIIKNPYRKPKKMPTWKESARLILEVFNRGELVYPP